MKFTKLLVLSALWLFGLSANAADLVERYAPDEPALSPVFDEESVAAIDKTAQDFVVGNFYVIYNTGAQQYYTQGNNWGTRASVGDIPIVVRFTVPEGKTLEDNALLLNDYNIRDNNWKVAFFDNADQIFVDRGSQANYFWQVVPQGNKVYRLQASPANPSLNPTNNPGFVGRNPDVPQDNSNNSSINTANTYPLSPFMESGFIDWEFYAVPEALLEGWTEYFELKDIYDKSQALKKQIENAETYLINVDAAAAVYNNEAATIAEMDAAIAELKAAIQAIKDQQAAGVGNGTPDNPSDATSMIQNPNFDDASNEGWSGTAPNMVGSGSHGPANVAEVYNNTFDTYQELSGMPAGVYALRANTAFRGSWEDMEKGTPAAAVLYAKAGEETQSVPFNNIWSCLNTTTMAGATEFGTSAAENGHGSYFSPNDPSAFRLYEEAGFYKTTLFFDMPGGSLQIGVKNEKKCDDGCDNWSIFDTFTLTYYGNEPGSYKKWVELSLPEVNKQAIFTQSYLDSYEAALAEKNATNREEALAAIEELRPYIDSLQLNITLWTKWEEKENEIASYMIDDKYSWTDAAGELSDYDMINAEEIREARTLNNGELQAEIDYIDSLVELMKQQQLAGWTTGTDVTFLLTNPGYQEGAKGWTVEGGGTSGSPLDNKNFEVYHVDNFDVWQEVKNALPGVYEIQVQGFSRYDGSERVVGDPSSCPGAPIFLYMNTATTRFPNLWTVPMPAGTYGGDDRLETWYLDTDKDGNEYPNSMGSASQAFDLGLYSMSTFGIVAKEGDAMRIGVKGTNCGENWWTLWDNFKIIYQGTDPVVLKPALENALQDINLSQAMGKDVYAKAEKLQAAAQEAMGTNDGEAMFNVLLQIYDVTDEIRASVALFAQLEAAADNLNNAIIDAIASDETKNEAKALSSKITSGIENHEFENSEAEALIEEANAMVTKLALPAGYENATDEAPFDFTAIIVNPDYTEDTSGWSGTGAAWGGAGVENAEIFGKNFDYYQDIEGLPAGTYQINVKAFYRAGGADVDYKTYQENPEANNNAFIYGATILNGDTIVSSKPMKRLASEADSEYVGADGYVTLVGATEDNAGLAVPNNMTTASYEFGAGKYQNDGPIVKLAEGAKLRIGLKKETEISNNWTIFDSWTLLYFGANSAKEADGDAFAGIIDLTNVPTLNVELFTLDGRKANAAQKGIMIQKTTLSNGAVIVRKVRK